MIEEVREENTDNGNEEVLENKYKGNIVQGFRNIYWRRVY